MMLLLQDTAIILKRESERLAADKETLDSQVDRLDQVLQRLSVANSSPNGSTILDNLQQIYEDLKSNFAEEYTMYKLPAIALTQVFLHMARVTSREAFHIIWRYY